MYLMPTCTVSLQIYLPSLHNLGLLSSFLAAFAKLWCTASLRFPPAAAWYVWSACRRTAGRLILGAPAHRLDLWNGPYLQINPPLSHFLRESVFSGKSSSGRCSTSTRTDNSAWTSGRRRSSRADTMSYGSGIGTSLLRQWFDKHTHVCTHTPTLPEVSLWCSCSPVMQSPQNPCEQHCELKVSSSWLSFERYCWISQTDCAPGCPGPLGWLSLGLWLSTEHIIAYNV